MVEPDRRVLAGVVAVEVVEPLLRLRPGTVVQAEHLVEAVAEGPVAVPGNPVASAVPADAEKS
jgi:hypothetical protein